MELKDRGMRDMGIEEVSDYRTLLLTCSSLSESQETSNLDSELVLGRFLPPS